MRAPRRGPSTRPSTCPGRSSSGRSRRLTASNRYAGGSPVLAHSGRAGGGKQGQLVEVQPTSASCVHGGCDAQPASTPTTSSLKSQLDELLSKQFSPTSRLHSQ